MIPVVLGAASVVKKLNIAPKVSFATPSEKRAAKVIGPVIASANGGNLRAVAVLDSRRTIGIAKEQRVWGDGFAKVSPDVLAQYLPNRSALIAAIPAGAQSNPEAAAAYALSGVGNAAAKPDKGMVENPGGVSSLGGEPQSRTALYVVGGVLAIGVAIVALS
jgi:hypothetical protein